jgi:hypothetical protein
MERPIHTYDYIDEPFDDVTEILADTTATVLQSATTRAAEHARETVSRLRVPLGGFEIARDVTIQIGTFDPIEARRVRVPIRFRAASRAALFPSVEADLEVQALSLDPPYTQITLVGAYKPPLGVLGAAGDAIAGHRIAEIAIRRLVQEIVARLKTELASRRAGLSTAHP